MNMRLETKGIGGAEHEADEEIAAAVEALTKSTTDGLKGFDGRLKEVEDFLAKIEAKANRPRAGGGGGGDIDTPDRATERKNLNAFVRGEFKTMTVAVDPQAGYFVPDILQPTITEKLYDPPTMLGLVRTEQWEGAGGEWIEPLKRALLTARRRTSETEAAADTGATNPVGLLTVPAGEADALIQISQKLLDDSARDLSTMVVSDMEAAFDRQLDAEIISGTGAGNQAMGFLSLPILTTDDTTRAWGQIQYVPSTSASAVTADSLKDLMYALRAPYRQGATWVMSSATANSVDKLKNGDGDYIWRDSLQAGTPPSLLGFPVAFDENMPAIAGNAFPIAFGNWKLGYLVAKKKQTRLLRDPYSAKPNLQLYGYKRQGGAVANSEAIKVLKIAVS